MQYTAEQVMQASPVIPVIVIENLEDALPLAKALIAGGIKVLEVTLRSNVALAAIKQLSEQLNDAIVGVGTVTNRKQLQDAVDHGAQFAISPGITDELLSAKDEINIPLLPGIASISELMRGIDAGLQHFKFFPAVPAGGIPMLKSIAGPFPDIKFCPTGGVNQQNFTDFLQLKNVECVGGSWVAASKLIKAGDWDAISELAHQAVSIADKVS